MKVLFTYDYGPEKMAMIRALGYEVTLIHESEIENNDTVNEADVLVCYNPFNRIDLEAMQKLKFIQLSSTGFDQLPQFFIGGTAVNRFTSQFHTITKFFGFSP